MNKTLRHMIRSSSSIDISVLIHLIEQTTQEVILTERATALGSSGGFSGFIAPRSWATNLVTHSTHAGHAHALKPNALREHLNRIWGILIRISNGIPDYWKVPAILDGKHKEPHPGIIAVRLFWSIVFVMVNLHPSHELSRFVRDLLGQFIRKISKFVDSFFYGFEALGFSVSCLPGNVDRESFISSIHRIYHHEEVLMLQGPKLNTHPDLSLFAGSIIKFRTLNELRNVLARNTQTRPTNQAAELNSDTITETELWESEELVGSQPDESQTSQRVPVRPDTPISIADSEEGDGDTEPNISPQDAALCISRAWRQSVEREEQRRRLSEYDQAGRLYEQYRQHFPKRSTEISDRDKLRLKLIRGPCIEIALGLRLLAEEIDGYVAALNLFEEVFLPELTSAEPGGIQKNIEDRKVKAEKYKDGVLTCYLLDSLIPKNLAAVKTQTRKAWKAFTAVKDSQILPLSEKFEEIEALISRGRDAVLNPRKPPQ